MRFCSIVLATSLLISQLAQPAIAEFVVPNFRGTQNSTYQEWRFFTSATEPNLPDVANSNPNGDATLQELTGGAFITGGGNIYSFAVATSFELLVPDYGLGGQHATSVVLQIRTLGSTVDLDSVTLNGLQAESAELLYEEPLGGFGGLLRDWKFEWNEVTGNKQLNTILFEAEESSMSLDRVSVDTLAAATAMSTFVAARVLHVGYGGAGEPPYNALDFHKQLVLRGLQAVALGLDNLVSSNFGINGLVLDLDQVSDLNEVELSFQMSPQGTFDAQSHPIESWQLAPAPMSIALDLGQGEMGSDRVVVQWSNLTIADRYLRILVTVGGQQLAELLIGHLTGKTIDSVGEAFTVSFADILPIRAAIGQSADASHPLDINKDATLSFADISAMRGKVGTQLTRLIVPPVD